MFLDPYFLQKASSVFSEPQKFGCYIIMDPANPISLNAALRYWGCAIQAGAQLSGAFGLKSPNSPMALDEILKINFSPLPSSFIPHLELKSRLNWDEVMVNDHSKDARDLLSVTEEDNTLSSVKFDPSNKSVTLFMPGFDKSEIKLYQVCLPFTFIISIRGV